jgi:hypothetical protein
MTVFLLAPVSLVTARIEELTKQIEDLGTGWTVELVHGPTI